MGLCEDQGSKDTLTCRAFLALSLQGPGGFQNQRSLPSTLDSSAALLSELRGPALP